jgi:hypothetical protein
MINKEQLQSKINELNVERKATLGEFIYEVYKDKFVEIYVGDLYEQISTEQVSTPYPAVFCGKIIAAYRECLILDGVYIDKKTRKQTLGNIMFINERAIRALCEVDGRGLLGDMFLKSSETLSFKNSVNG